MLAGKKDGDDKEASGMMNWSPLGRRRSSPKAFLPRREMLPRRRGVGRRRHPRQPRYDLQAPALCPPRPMLPRRSARRRRRPSVRRETARRRFTAAQQSTPGFHGLFCKTGRGIQVRLRPSCFAVSPHTHTHTRTYGRDPRPCVTD